MDKFFELERFLTEVERRATNEARRHYPENKELAEKLARLVQETRTVKRAVIREVQSAAA